MTMKIKAWDVTVTGYGEARYYAASRGKALAAAWRCDAFGNISFRDFLKIASCWKAIFIPEGFGSPITVEGKPAFYIERNCAYVRIAYPGATNVMSAHPYDVLPIEFRPEPYRVQA